MRIGAKRRGASCAARAIIYGFLSVLTGFGFSYAYAATVPLDIGDAELHAIGVYEGDAHKNGKVRVHVSVQERPIVLVLSAYESVEWKIELEPGVNIKAIIATGYHKQTVSGIAPNVPLFVSFAEEGGSYRSFGYRNPEFLDNVRYHFRRDPATAHAQYKGTEFLISGKVLSGIPNMKEFHPAQPKDQTAQPTRRREGLTIINPQEIVYPVTAGGGTISRATIEKYNTLAVYKLVDALGAPGSGSIAAGILSAQLASKGFTVVERAHLEKLLDEQRLQLTHGDEKVNRLSVGRLAGARGVIVGDVTQWATKQMISEQGEQYHETNVAIAFRLLDVETGTVLFSGNGHFARPSTSLPQGAAQLIFRGLVTRLALKAGLVGTGRTGFVWDMGNRTGVPFFKVTEFDQDSPAYKAGLRSGDIIISCNGSSSDNWKNLWQSMTACQAEAGQTLEVEVGRGGQRLTLSIKAADRFISHQ